MTGPVHTRVLLIDEDASRSQALRATLMTAGIEPVEALDDDLKLPNHLSDAPPRLILLDLDMTRQSPLTLFSAIQKQAPQATTVVLSSKRTLKTAHHCLQNGARDHLLKPVENRVLIQRIRDLSVIGPSRPRVAAPLRQHAGMAPERREIFGRIITGSPLMARLFQYMEAIADSDEPVLITGETGTGKGLIANSLHHLKNPKRPLIIKNIAGLDDTVFADTLFGHDRGAFTGPGRKRTGLVAKAADGTLVLDEIGDLSPSSQVKLLRLIQEKTFTPLGADTSHVCRARILVTTHRNLDKAVERGDFRRDLYYRLATHKIHLPPLRKRREDIPALLAHFIDHAAGEINKKIPPPSQRICELLMYHAFPGNIRELRAMALEAAIRYKGSGPLSLEPFLSAVRDRNKGRERNTTITTDSSRVLQLHISRELPLPTLKAGLKQMEGRLVKEALRRTNGNQSRAAALLGLSRQAFYKRFRNNRQLR